MLFDRLTTYVSDFIHLIFPEQCPSCNDILQNTDPICRFCEAGLPRTQSHIVEVPHLSKNLQGRIHTKHVFSFMTYSQKGISQNIISNIKYKNRPDLAEYLGYKYSLELMEKGIFLDDSYTLIPVPLHPKKKMKRGFNQSEEICTGINKAFGFSINTKSLLRISDTESQTRKNRESRWSDLNGVFTLENPDLIKNKNIILVDDVFTTGATFEVCYNELIQAKPKSVSILSLAARI